MPVKKIVAVCRRNEGALWTSLTAAKKGEGLPVHGRLERISPPGEAEGWEAVAKGLTERVCRGRGWQSTVGLDASELLLRVVELPTREPAEWRGMVDLQIDRFSPFPAEKQLSGFEVLLETENKTRVVLAAVRRAAIDDLGTAFRAAGLLPRRVDVELLGWWRMLGEKGRGEPGWRDIFLRQEEMHTDLVAVEGGAPVLFRSLQSSAAPVGLGEEIGYSLTTLETEWGHAPARITAYGVTDEEASRLAEECGVPVTAAADGPPSSEGLARRLLEQGGDEGLNLIPDSWREEEKVRRLRKGLWKATGLLLGVWLAAVLLFVSGFNLQQSRLVRLEAEAARWEERSAHVRMLQDKVRSLENYANRSRSALESLREVSRLLPAGIELNGFNYRKGAQIALRGEADSEAPVYDYLRALEESPFFIRVETEGLSSRRRDGRSRTEFRVTLTLPGGAE